MDPPAVSLWGRGAKAWGQQEQQTAMRSVRRRAAEPGAPGWPSSLSGLKAGEESRADVPGAGPPWFTHVKSQVDPPTGSPSGERAGSRPLEPTRAWEEDGRAGAIV